MQMVVPLSLPRGRDGNFSNITCILQMAHHHVNEVLIGNCSSGISSTTILEMAEHPKAESVTFGNTGASEANNPKPCLEPANAGAWDRYGRQLKDK